MKINQLYPYPVLFRGNNDYINSSFNTEIDVKHSFGEVKITAKFKLINDVIERLIQMNDFVYLIHVECGYTSYRKIFPTNEDQIEIYIRDNLLRGKVVIHSFIVAQNKIKNYSNPLFNKWYQDLTFSIEKGNVIAIGEAVEINLYENPMELLDLPSIITIMKSLKKDYMEVDMYSDNIIIELPEKEYNYYAANAKSILKNTILTAVIVPALVHVFSKIATSNKEDLEGYTWYQVLEKIFADNQLKIEDVGTDSLSALKAAQLVLRKPYKATLEEIEKFLISRGEE